MILCNPHELPANKLNITKRRLDLARCILDFLKRPDVSQILAGRFLQFHCFLYWLVKQQTVLDDCFQVAKPEPADKANIIRNGNDHVLIYGLCDQVKIHLGLLLCFFSTNPVACNRPPDDEEDEAAADLIAGQAIVFAVPPVSLTTLEDESKLGVSSRTFPDEFVFLFLLLLLAVKQGNRALVANLLARSAFKQAVGYLHPALLATAQELLRTREIN